MGYLTRAPDDDQVCCDLVIPQPMTLTAIHRYGINNIRTLVGHKVPIENVEKSPAVRF
jgi:hypothetical protein